MSVNVKYKDNTIAEITTTSTKTLKTKGKYCEDDIILENIETDSYRDDYIYINPYAYTYYRLFYFTRNISELTIDFTKKNIFDEINPSQAKSVLINDMISGGTSKDYTLKKVNIIGDTSRTGNANNLFYYRSGLEEIEGTLNFSNATHTNTFQACENLREIRFAPNSIKKTISLAHSPLLSDESINSIINGLDNVTTATQLALHTDVKSKLTEEQKSIIGAKGWTL